MNTEQFITTILTPSEGYFYLTQKDNTIDIKDRIIATKLALGKNDNPDNWIEITQEEGFEYIKQIDEANKAPKTK